MVMKYDLHSHTTASDGTYTPAELVKKASALKIEHLAITDHDNVNGVQEALQAGQKDGVNVIPGVEISVEFQPGTMHVCGYFVDINNDILNEKLAFVQQARRDRNPKIIEKLNEQGVEITLQEVQEVAGSDQVGRPNIAKVLIQKGYVNGIKEAFNKYLAKGASCYVNKKRLDLTTAIKTIKAAGGIPVLAHPVQLGLNSEAEYYDLFVRLKKAGIAGIEAFSSHHNEKDNQTYYKLAKKLNMLITGGSDFHGKNKPKVKLGQFGEKPQVDLDKFLNFN
jgi:hypothetical protein